MVYGNHFSAMKSMLKHPKHLDIVSSKISVAHFVSVFFKCYPLDVDSNYILWQNSKCESTSICCLLIRKEYRLLFSHPDATSVQSIQAEEVRHSLSATQKTLY